MFAFGVLCAMRVSNHYLLLMYSLVLEDASTVGPSAAVVARLCCVACCGRFVFSRSLASRSLSVLLLNLSRPSAKLGLTRKNYGVEAPLYSVHSDLGFVIVAHEDDLPEPLSDKRLLPESRTPLAFIISRTCWGGA